MNTVKVLAHGSELKNIKSLGFEYNPDYGYIKLCASWEEAHNLAEQVESGRRLSCVCKRAKGDWDSFGLYRVETDELELYFN